MKKIYLIVIALLIVSTTQAQEQDTLKVFKKGTKTSMIIDTGGVSITVGKADSTKKEKKTVKYPHATFGITFEHFDIGLSKFHTGSDFSAPVGYDYLENKPWKTSNIGFDLLQFGVRFNPSFKIMLEAGIDWDLIRLVKNVTIEPDKPTLTATPSTIVYDKNRLSSKYLRIPLYFEYRSPQSQKGKRISIVGGPEIGFLLGGKTKQISSENGKVKVKDDFNFEPFRYGANIRIGYGGVGLFFKYYMNDVFAKNQGPADYKNLNFGLTFGF
ncbi:outer membrane beta-barrel protein [Pedobacter sp. SD-b]|uniref:Outer membrane beta-barrel protein n=1 Tax=Pedobacter segetis TaxID=2793069 RepID=A0ABS1BN42_9SPHI|nr:outer membrane beta-barrel protein [Pedobacter segetis]MBK0383726.1 outer membrane beta-barrel protein [Pedobacter segetis]